MPSMSQTEIEDFLQAPRHAIVGTNPVDGPPQLSPVWYLYENGRLYISVAVNTVKHRNLKRDPRISVCVDGCRPDGRTVMFSGTAELVQSGDPLQTEMRKRIIYHYHETDEAAQRFFVRAVENDAVLIIVAPEKVISQAF